MNTSYWQTTKRRLMVPLGSTIGLFLSIWLFWSRSTHPGILISLWFLAINIVTFFYFAWDKRQAGRDNPRVPESVLHTLCFLGGTPGAYLAMRWFRHKTIKGRFRILFWSIASLQAGIGIWMLSRWFV